LTHHPEEIRMRLLPATPRPPVVVGSRRIGTGEPVYVIAEIGINHNGSLELARKLIDGAVLAGADCVKFQKRTPELCTPRDQWDLERDTPWGRIRYIDYRHKVEFNFAQFAEIDRHCRDRGIAWTASAWDEPSVEFLARFSVPFLKVASASVTDLGLLSAVKASGIPTMLSTGMSTTDEIDRAIALLGEDGLLLAHTTSSYPCPPKELNLRCIEWLHGQYPLAQVGYSGHEVGLATTYAAVVMGATFVERHVTLDRSMWGSDQAASVEIVGLQRLVRDLRTIEESLGDGIKVVYPSEAKARERLRRVAPAVTELVG
jgi:N-acetylneuraminate synthase